MAHDEKQTLEAALPNAPVKKPVKKKKRKKRKANRTVSLIFYTCYFALVTAVLAGLYVLNLRLTGWLAVYEQAQPDVRCAAIFEANFSDPDWNSLGQLAGITHSKYENRDAFAAYMEAKVADRELSYTETSDGLLDSRKYLLKADGETIGFFTLVNQAPEGSKIANWQLGQVSLSHSFSQSVTVQSPSDATVYVNGTALTDDHTIRVGTAPMAEYLDDGIRSPRIYTQYLDGLMVEPAITAVDSQGNPAEVIYDESLDLYLVRTAQNTIGTEEENLALAAAKVYGLRMVGNASAAQLDRYFATDSSAYSTILRSPSWTQSRVFSNCQWGQGLVTDYWRYSEDLFSVHVTLPMVVTCTDGTTQEYRVDHSFLFRRSDNSWKCITLLGGDFQPQPDAVRLTFLVGESVVYTNLFSQDTTTLTLPLVTAPVGMTFGGWYRADTAADGTTAYTLIFADNQSGTVILPAGTALEPMTLHAMFTTAQ